MTPINQDKFGGGEGNCFAACIASLLDLPLSSVPNFITDKDWWGSLQEWLGERGLFAIEFALNGPPIVGSLPDGLLGIATGKSPRGLDHAVICRLENLNLVIVHDPHPSHAGFVGDPTHLMFLARTFA